MVFCMKVLNQKKYKPGSHGLLSLLSPWIEDNNVSEILINRPGEAWVESAAKMRQHKIPEITTLYLKRLFTFIANENCKTIGEKNPIFSGNIYYDMRVQLVIPPAAKEYTLSIRKKSKHRISLKELNQNNFYSNVEQCSVSDTEHSNETLENELLSFYKEKAWMDFIEKAVYFKKNIIISGATSSGKTSLLNACLECIPSHERIITLEDTFELSVPHSNKVSLLSQENKPNYSMQSLLRCVLRLRPDRILIGEIRGSEVLDFIESCQTGHRGSITTIHANNPKGVISRMMHLYKKNNVPSMTDDEIKQEVMDVVDIIVQLQREGDRRYISHIYYKAVS